MTRPTVLAWLPLDPEGFGEAKSKPTFLLITEREIAFLAKELRIPSGASGLRGWMGWCHRGGNGVFAIRHFQPGMGAIVFVA